MGARLVVAFALVVSFLAVARLAAFFRAGPLVVCFAPTCFLTGRAAEDLEAVAFLVAARAPDRAVRDFLLMVVVLRLDDTEGSPKLARKRGVPGRCGWMVSILPARLVGGFSGRRLRVVTSCLLRPYQHER